MQLAAGVYTVAEEYERERRNQVEKGRKRFQCKLVYYDLMKRSERYESLPLVCPRVHLNRLCNREITMTYETYHDMMCMSEQLHCCSSIWLFTILLLLRPVLPPSFLTILAASNDLGVKRSALKVSRYQQAPKVTLTSG